MTFEWIIRNDTKQRSLTCSAAPLKFYSEYIVFLGGTACYFFSSSFCMSFICSSIEVTSLS